MTSRFLRSAGLQGPATYVFAGRVVALASGLGTALLASRALGADGRGLVVGFSAIQFLLANGLALGTGSAAYLVASRREMEAPKLAGAVLLIGAAVAGVAALVAAIAIVSGFAERFLPGLPLIVVLLVAPAAGSQYVAMTMIQLSMGLGRPVSTMATLAIAPFLLLASTVAVAFLGGDAAMMAAGYAIAWLAAAIAAMLVISARPEPTVDRARALVATGRPAALGDVANALSYRSDVILLGLLAGPAAVGVYALAVQALEPLWILAGSAAGGLLISLPDQPRATWRSSVARSTVRVAGVTALGVAAVIALMPLVAEVAGPGFQTAPLVALALGPAIVLLAASKTLAAAQLAAGRLWWGTIISSASVVVNVVANMAFVPLLGAVGAGLASTTSYGASAAIWLMALRRR